MFDAGRDKSFGEILRAVESFVAGLEVAEYAPADVPVVIKRLVKAEKLCASGRILMARRAAELHDGGRDGETSAAKWFAGESGEAVGKARRDLEISKKLADQPELEDALRNGSISPTQASVILPALEADPESGRELISAASRDSLNELRDQSQRIVAAKRSEEEASEREARLRARRQLYFGTTAEGAVSIRGELPPVDGALVKNTLEAMSRKVFEEARREGRREAHEAYMADALVALCNPAAAALALGANSADASSPETASTPAGTAAVPGSNSSAGSDSSGSDSSGSDSSDGSDNSGTGCSPDLPARPSVGSAPATPRAEIILHVDVEALRRGELETGERCEIEGVGPVALSTVEYLFGNAWAKLIISKGVDIASVTHFGRWIPAHLETALSRRDRVCQVPGCGISYGLERDHIIPFEEGGPTELANLAKLCKRHHFLKTHKYFRLIGRPGDWNWVNIRPDQHVVAVGDRFDVTGPGEPTAGLAPPTLSPREPIWPDSDSDGSAAESTVSASTVSASVDAPAERWTQPSLAYSRGRVVTVRITPEFLASLRAERELAERELAERELAGLDRSTHAAAKQQCRSASSAETSPEQPPRAFTLDSVSEGQYQRAPRPGKPLPRDGSAALPTWPRAKQPRPAASRGRRARPPRNPRETLSHSRSWRPRGQDRLSARQSGTSRRTEPPSSRPDRSRQSLSLRATSAPAASARAEVGTSHRLPRSTCRDAVPALRTSARREVPRPRRGGRLALRGPSARRNDSVPPSCPRRDPDPALLGPARGDRGRRPAGRAPAVAAAQAA